MLDAYTVRKAIPRVLVAVIAINLSLYLCVAAIDITTIIGRGLNRLITAPFLDADSFSAINGIKLEQNAENTILGVPGVGGVLAAIIATFFVIGVGTAAVAILGLLLPLLVTIALIAVAVLFTLVIRQGLLVFLCIISPVAIVCYILPGTEKYFRQWLDLFTRTLMVYPIVAAIFAMCNVLAAILLKSASGAPASMFNNQQYFAQATPDGIGLIQLLAAVIVLYAPLVLIPFAFKLAGGAISAVMNTASGRAANLAGRAGKAIQQSRHDPNSMLGKAKMDARNRRTDRGFTGRQMWAKRPGFGEARRQRIGAAKELDQFVNREQSKETYRAKMNAQDSDIQDSLVMSSQQVEKDKFDLRRKLDSGQISAQQYDRKMRAHALADQMGRTTANRQAAFLNSERIKFSAGTGKAGYDAERKLAQDIFGSGADAAAAMNAHQAIANGVGRADLAQGLYGDEGSMVRSSAKSGASQILSGHSNGVEGALKDHLSVINDTSKSVDERTQAAQFLANMLSNSSSPYGAGNEANKRMVLQKRGEIDKAFEAFAADKTFVDPNTGKAVQGAYLHEEMEKPSGTQITETVKSPNGSPLLDANGRPIEVTKSADGSKLPAGEDAAKTRLQRMSGAEIDPAKAAASATVGATAGGGGSATGGSSGSSGGGSTP